MLGFRTRHITALGVQSTGAKGLQWVLRVFREANTFRRRSCTTAFQRKNARFRTIKNNADRVNVYRVSRSRYTVSALLTRGAVQSFGRPVAPRVVPTSINLWDPDIYMEIWNALLRPVRRSLAPAVNARHTLLYVRHLPYCFTRATYIITSYRDAVNGERVPGGLRDWNRVR